MSAAAKAGAAATAAAKAPNPFFRSKKLDLGCYVNIKVIRDHTKRKAFAEFETQRYRSVSHPSPLFNCAATAPMRRKSQTLTTSRHRQALRYIIRNLQLPARMRAQAQLELSQMHCYTRPTQIKNRCIEGGKGRGILSDFKMSRVRLKLRLHHHIRLDGEDRRDGDCAAANA